MTRAQRANCYRFCPRFVASFVDPDLDEVSPGNAMTRDATESWQESQLSDSTAGLGPEAGDEESIVPPGDDKAQEWIIALAAAGFDYRLSHEPAGWVIHVPKDAAVNARAEIEAYEADNRNWPAPPRPAPPNQRAPYDTWSSLWVAGMLIAFYVWLGPYRPQVPLLQLAAADTDRILAGEWWRVITALTVHADVSHLLANVLSLYFLGHAVCRTMGGGLGWALILGAGIAGNTSVAWVLHADQTSVGASTCNFAALGILTAWQAIQRLRYGRGIPGVWDRTWLPIGAGLALLATLGTGPRSDLGAHALGFLCGMVAATPVAWYDPRRIPDWLQPVLKLACLVTVMGAWRIVINAVE